MKFILTSFLLITLSTVNAQDKQATFGTLYDKTTGRYDSYLASDGAVYKVGDKITLDNPFVNCSQFYSYINIQGSVTMASAMLKGSQVRIHKIKVEGNSNRGYTAVIYAEGIEIFGIYEIELEKAISSKEIICLGITEEKALEQLRKAKEKLDLELINQEEYNRLKNELSGYIK